MKILGTHLNLTPVFRVVAAGASPDPWRRVSGAVQSQSGGLDWLFPAYYPFGLSAYRDLMRLAPHLEWDESTKPHVEALLAADKLWQAALHAHATGADVPLPPGLDFPPGFEPYQHQKLGITMASTWWRAFFLWEMGTGKTRTLVDAFRLSRRENPGLQKMLVLAPPVVLPTWVSEVDRCSQGALSAAIWDGTDKGFERAKAADVVVISYARARLEFDPSRKGARHLKDLDYQVLVADESHSIGNYDSAQTQAALTLSSKAARRYLLSGTAADHPGKLYSQFRFLSPGLMPLSWRQYKDAHFVYSQFRKGQVFGYKNLDDLNSRVDLVSSRMKKKDCLDLPPVTFVDVPFDLTGEQIEAYDACIARLKDFARYQELHEGQGVSVPHGGALVNKLLQIVSGFAISGADPLICDSCEHLVPCVERKIRPYTEACKVVPIKPPSEIVRFPGKKLGVFKELLDNILSDDDTNKVIVWGTYIEELNDIQAAVEKLGYGFVRVDGSSTSRIGEISKTFQTDPNCRVYIGQVNSGVGVTLTAANYMIYYALTWNLTSYKQSLERNNRPGQTRNMVVYRLLSTHPGALDQFLANVLQFKDNVAYTMLERVTCSTCDRMRDCAKAEIRPFRNGCKYASNVSKPTATAEYLNIQLKVVK